MITCNTIKHKLEVGDLRQPSKVVHFSNLEVGQPLWVDQVLVFIIIGSKQTIRCNQFVTDLRALSQMTLQ